MWNNDVCRSTGVLEESDKANINLRWNSGEGCCFILMYFTGLNQGKKKNQVCWHVLSFSFFLPDTLS